MFDFTTETILNELSRVKKLDDTNDETLATGKTALYVARLNKFLNDNIVGVYKTVGSAAVKEVAGITVPASAVTGSGAKVFRLIVNITIDGAEPAEYARFQIYKGKPLMVEAVLGTDAANQGALATALAAKFAKGLLKNGESEVTVAASGNDINITAIDEFQKISATLEVYDDTLQVFTSIATSTVKTAAKVGVGTTDYLVKNLRLPTFENLRPTAILQDERPVANSLYTQYTIRYKSPRPELGGMSAVGQVVESVTTHVLFVLSTQVAAFEAILKAAVTNSKVVDAKTNAAVTFP